MGSICSLTLPNALLPPIKKNELEVTTKWPGKSAQDIEQTLIAPLEIILSGLNGNVLIESTIQSGEAVTRLEFKSDIDMTEVYSEALARVNQVPDWPAEVPVSKVNNKADGVSSTLASIMLYSNGVASDFEFAEAFENYVKPALMKVEGVASIDTSSNPTQQRIDVNINMAKLNDFGISLNNIIGPLSNLVDTSGGKLELGSRDYEFHYNGQLELDQLVELPVYIQGNYIVRLKDLATVGVSFESDWSYASIKGHKAFYFSLKPTKEINVLIALDALKQVIKELNANELKSLNMEVMLSRDDSIAVNNAIKQLYIALLMGVILSSIILLFFVRQFKTIALVFVSVPVCISFIFIAMSIFKYSINVISLAGIALSIGLILDASIIVVETIHQKLRKGEPLMQAIFSATSEVKMAILSSTFSSIAIFLPILLMDSPEAQLFKDLAFVISTALLASLISALVLTPILASFLMRKATQYASQKGSKLNQFLYITARRKSLVVFTLIVGLPISVWGTWVLMPTVDVLPEPKHRSVLSYIMIGDSMSSSAIEREISTPILARLAAQQNNPKAPVYDVTGMFCLAKLCLLYFYPPEEWDFDIFKQWIINEITQELPSTRIVVVQADLLRFALPNTRESKIDLQGDTLENLQLLSTSLLKRLRDKFPSARLSDGSALQNNLARVELKPDYEQLLRYNIDSHFLNDHIKTMTFGSYLGRIYNGGKSYPFYLRGQEISDLEQLLNTEIIIDGIGQRRLSELVNARFTIAPSELLRIDKRATISISAIPPVDMAMGTFSSELKKEVGEYLKSQDNLDLVVSYRGSADRLRLFLQDFAETFVLSLLILLFLLWFTLKSWKLTTAVMSSMPLAIFGGMVSLAALNKFTNQNLDMVTIIGFIILMGLVINNGILLASHFQQCLRRGVNQTNAICSAIESRRRAIYMSTGTSIFGMLPLMLSPSEGSEIYRGLAAVIIGGMTFSALFSMNFMASVLSLPLFKNVK